MRQLEPLDACDIVDAVDSVEAAMAPLNPRASSHLRVFVPRFAHLRFYSKACVFESSLEASCLYVFISNRWFRSLCFFAIKFAFIPSSSHRSQNVPYMFFVSLF